MIWFKLLAAIPDLIRLLRAIESGYEQAETQRKVKDDIKTVASAFETNDASKLNSLFNR